MQVELKVKDLLLLTELEYGPSKAGLISTSP